MDDASKAIRNQNPLRGDLPARDRFELSLGKMQPQATELEAAVLGMILSEQRSYKIVADLLRPEHFYRPEHVIIYRAYQEMTNAGQTPDILTITQHLRTTAELDLVGGPLAIAKLTSYAGNIVNLDFNARIIVQKFMAREVIRISQESLMMAYNEMTDPFDLISHVQTNTALLLQSNVKQDARPIGASGRSIISSIEARKPGADWLPGLTSGIRVFDKFTGGFRKTQLYIVAGRPGMGKSAFMGSVALNQSEKGIPSAIFSLEMSHNDLAYRMLSMVTGIDLEILTKQYLDADRMRAVHQGLGVLERQKVFVDDTAGLSIFDAKAKLGRLIDRYGVEIAYFDYTQLMNVGAVNKRQANNREQEIALVSRTMKEIAKEFDIPVVALAQLSRQTEHRADRRPQLSDLRESGALEQDPDMVMFLYRPEYYGIAELDDGTSSAGVGFGIVAKNRHGNTGEIKMRYSAYKTGYGDLDNFESPTIPVAHPDNRIEPNTGFLGDDPF